MPTTVSSEHLATMSESGEAASQPAHVAPPPESKGRRTKGGKYTDPESKRRHRGAKIAAVGALAVAVGLGVAGAEVYKLLNPSATAVPGAQDEGLLIKDEIKAQVTRQPLAGIAGWAILHSNVRVLQTPDVLPAGDNRNLLRDFIPHGQVDLVQYPALITRNGHEFYQFSQSAAVAKGSQDAGQIADGKAYVQVDSPGVEFKPDPSLHAPIPLYFDDGGNFLIDGTDTVAGRTMFVGEGDVGKFGQVGQVSQAADMAGRAARG